MISPADQTRAGRPILAAVDGPKLQVIAPERVADLLGERLPEDQVPGLLPRKAVVVLFGDANSGKTFLALDLSVCIATGRDFAGRKTRQGGVLYIVAEGGGGFVKRLRALAQKYPDLPSAPLRVLRQAVNLRAMTQDLMIRARDVEQDAGDLGLIVIDTLSQTIWGDENGKEMAEYVGAAGLLANSIGCPVLILHHQGKDASRGMRGNSSLRGNVDVAIHLKSDADGNVVATTDPAAGGKTRDDEPVTIGFRLRAVPVGRNAAGHEISSCVVQYQDASADRPGRRPPITGAARKLLVELAGELARASSRYREDGTPVVSRGDLETAWGAAKRATYRDKQAAPSYMVRPLNELVAAGH